MALTKLSIVERISETLRYSPNEAARVLELLLEQIKQTLESGDDLMISGFGKLNVKEKQQRKGRNPSTSEPMMLPSRRVVTFTCSGKLRTLVNS